MTMRALVRRTARFCGFERWANKPFVNAGATFERGSIVEALRQWQQLAGEGDCNAKFVVGLIEGAPPVGRANLALSWLQDAAERGVIRAQELMGTAYSRGCGVAQDFAESLNWWRKAAEHRSISAQEHLGWMFFVGANVPQDYTEAHKWFETAAREGSAFSQLALSLMHYAGRGTARDESKAEAWLRRAADQDVTDEQSAHGLYYVPQPTVGPAPHDDAEALARYAADAEQGLDLAQYRIALRYLAGIGLSQSYDDAAQWLRRAADQGLGNAQYRLGFLYAFGKGVTRDHGLAHFWLNLAAASSSGPSLAATARDIVAERMSFEEVLEAQGIARMWEPNGSPTAE